MVTTKWISIAALLASVSSPLQSQQRVRIVTFNGEWIVGSPQESEIVDWSPHALKEHHERIAGIIETLEPDVVNLVEVTSQAALETIVGILHEKGMTRYRGYHLDLNDTYTGQDVSLITRLPPVEVDGSAIRTIYSEPPDREWRLEYTWRDDSGRMRRRTTSISKNVLYYFDFGGTRVGFLGLHLIANPSHPRRNAQRTAQSLIARKIVEREIVARGFLPIVLGDFNDFDGEVQDRVGSVPLTPVLSNLKDYEPSNPGPELINVAELIDRRFDRYTTHWDKNYNDRVDADEPMTMLDHILIHRDLRSHVTRVFIDHGHGAGTTDHWPVVMDLVFP